jgi:hypothetical protein
VSLNIQVAGVGGVPVGGISAVVLNITAVDPTVSSFFTVFPEGTSQPAVSNLNFTAGETLANLVTVAVGSQGGVTIYNHAGNANVLADVEGYYTTMPLPTGLYNPVSPLRILGTAASGISVGAGMSTPVKVAGVDGVPVDASAVVANVTVSGPSSAGFVTTFPAPDGTNPTPPIASNLNFSTGQVIANRVIIPVGSGGKIEVYNYTGSVKVDVDLNGYYTGSSGELGSAFTPISPARFVDTRVGTNGTPTSSNSSEDFSFISEGISVTATALASNVTVVAGTATGYMSVYPTTDSSPPVVSDANFLASSVVQNFTVAPLDQGNVYVFNSSAAPINIVIDAFGYFAPPPTATHVVADPTSLPADGMSTSTVTATVTTGSGIAFDDPITISTAPSVTGSCGSVSATGSTNASGQVISTYTASTTAGTCTVTATEANGGTQGSVVITQT